MSKKNTNPLIDAFKNIGVARENLPNNLPDNPVGSIDPMDASDIPRTKEEAIAKYRRLVGDPNAQYPKGAVEVGLGGIIPPRSTDKSVWQPSSVQNKPQPIVPQNPMDPSYYQIGIAGRFGNGQPPRAAQGAGGGGPINPGGLRYYENQIRKQAKNQQKLQQDTFQSLDEASRRIMQQQQIVGQLQSDYAREEYTILQKRQKALDLLEQRRQKAEEARKTAMKSAMDRLDADIQNFKNSHVLGYNERYSSGQKLGFGIAAALGSIGADLTGGPNYALQIIQSRIADDLNAQKAEIQRKGQLVNMDQNYLARMRQQFGDERASEAAAKAALYENYATQVELLASKYKSPLAEANATKLAYQLRKQAIKEKADFATTINRNLVSLYNSGINAAGKRIDAYYKQQALNLQRKAAALSAQARQSALPNINGLKIVGYGPPNKQSVKEAVTYWGYASSVADKLSRLKALRDKYGAELWTGSTAAGQEAKALANGLIVDLKMMKNMGAHFTESEEQLLNIPRDPGEFGWLSDRLGSIQRMYSREAKKYLYPRGYAPVIDSSSF